MIARPIAPPIRNSSTAPRRAVTHPGVQRQHAQILRQRHMSDQLARAGRCNAACCGAQGRPPAPSPPPLAASTTGPVATRLVIASIAAPAPPAPPPPDTVPHRSSACCTMLASNCGSDSHNGAAPVPQSDVNASTSAASSRRGTGLPGARGNLAVDQHPRLPPERRSPPATSGPPARARQLRRPTPGSRRQRRNFFPRRTALRPGEIRRQVDLDAALPQRRLDLPAANPQPRLIAQLHRHRGPQRQRHLGNRPARLHPQPSENIQPPRRRANPYRPARLLVVQKKPPLVPIDFSPENFRRIRSHRERHYIRESAEGYRVQGPGRRAVGFERGDRRWPWDWTALAPSLYLQHVPSSA